MSTPILVVVCACGSQCTLLLVLLAPKKGTVPAVARTCKIGAEALDNHASCLICADKVRRANADGRLDARLAIAGRATPAIGAAAAGAEAGEEEAPEWQSGLFDRGSWVEAQAGWARTVITGAGSFRVRRLKNLSGAVM
jgi:hypothetical protein